jgi:hypothetical protein
LKPQGQFETLPESPLWYLVSKLYLLIPTIIQQGCCTIRRS